MPYIYQADLWCDDCGKAICAEIKAAGNAPECPEDEASYDSDEYPKGPYADGESDSPQHCGSMDGCLNAIELEGGHKIGAWLENPLTCEGVEYLREAIAEGGEVAELWAEFYWEYL